jgi:enoyl-CoA hydratase/carnithine racemase
MLVHRQDVDRIAVLTLNNPPANGYSHAMHRELDAHLLDVRMDPAIDVIVIRGAGDRFFCAGADIAYLQSLEPEQKYAFCLHANETLLRLEHTPKLVIAALNGHCVGGGLEIALACDLRVGRESGAKPNLVGMPEVALGVLPGTGGTQRLSRILGRASALRFMVEGRNVPVEEALTLGLVHAVLPEDDWWQEVLKYARSFCAPHKAAGAVGLIKRAVVSGADLPLESGLALERELQQRLFTSPDAKEGVAAFLGKRPPTFSGRPVPGAPAESPGGGGERGESGATAAAGPSTAPAASSSPSGGGGGGPPPPPTPPDPRRTGRRRRPRSRPRGSRRCPRRRWPRSCRACPPARCSTKAARGRRRSPRRRHRRRWTSRTSTSTMPCSTCCPPGSCASTS